MVYLQSCSLGVLGLLVGQIHPPISATPIAVSPPLERLSSNDQATLRSGKVIVKGSKGDYVTQVLISAPLPVVWDVLTDYDQLPKFLPGVVSSKVLEVQGDRKIVEQVDSRRILMVQIRSRLRSAITEVFLLRRIEFELVDGDLQQMEGYWQLDPVGAAPQVLLTQRIVAQPKASVPKTIFYDVFKSSLEKNFNAIRMESERRVSSYSQHP
jgi:ribosome-associated toxin RatA of RatAB toxin-antitoxin module